MMRSEIEEIANAAADKAVKKTLLALGIDASDADSMIEHQADNRFVRRWRTGAEAVGFKSVLTIVTLAVTGLCGLVWAAVSWKFGH